LASKLSGIELTRYDDLFKTDAEREADRQERIQIVPAAEVFPYSRQPYTIDRPTPDLVRLMDSIEHIGIAEPLIVRPRESGGYEIISGSPARLLRESRGAGYPPRHRPQLQRRGSGHFGSGL